MTGMTGMTGIPGYSPGGVGHDRNDRNDTNSEYPTGSIQDAYIDIHWDMIGITSGLLLDS
jgi:hypothetical protein